MATSLFLVVFAAAGLLVLSGFVLVAVLAVKGARATRRAGIDPYAPESVVLAQALRGDARSLEQRLAELDDLHRRGVISSEEHAAARRQALQG